MGDGDSKGWKGRMSVPVHLYMRTCIDLYAGLYTHIYIDVGARVGEHTYVYAFICVEGHVQACVCVCMYVEAVHNLRCHSGTLFLLF